MQEIILYGLSQSGFFKTAAFYGGTTLRIFYELDRFSEDLDFSLLQPDTNFDLSSFLPELQNIVESFGIKVDVDTKEYFLLFYPNSKIRGINKNEKIKMNPHIFFNL